MVHGMVREMRQKQNTPIVYPYKRAGYSCYGNNVSDLLPAFSYKYVNIRNAR